MFAILEEARTTLSEHHLDLLSINFEHFIESTKQPENSPQYQQTRKRVCIITDHPMANHVYEQADSLSDFIDRQTNEPNGLDQTQSTTNDQSFYKDLTGSPIECRKLTPSGKNLDDNR